MIIEFAGLPAAGKSTTIGLLRETLSNKGYTYTVIPTALSVSPIGDLKQNWVFDAWALCRSIKQTIELSENPQIDVAIFERGIIDTLCWLEWFKMLGEIEPEVMKIVEQFALLPSWSDRIDLIVILQANFQTALKRNGHSSWIIDEAKYNDLRVAFGFKTRMVHHLRPSLNLLSLETDSLSPLEVHDLVWTRLEDLGLSDKKK